MDVSTYKKLSAINAKLLRIYDTITKESTYTEEKKKFLILSAGMGFQFIKEALKLNYDIKKPNIN